VGYRSALGLLPARRVGDDLGSKGKARAESPGADSDSGGEGGVGEGEGHANAREDVAELPSKEMSALEKECAKVRSVLNANIGACHVKLVRPPLVYATYGRCIPSCPRANTPKL
jgi:hypothetical protein